MTFLKNIHHSQLSDKELIDAFKESDNPDFVGVLYQRYMDLVFGVCLKYFKEGERSKDAVMEIYEELCKKLKLHEVAHFKGWLAVLARNYCLMQLRSPRNLKTVEFNVEVMQNNQTGHLENTVLEREENFKKLEDCLQQLIPEQKQSVELFFLEKKCYNEIAALTGFDWSKVRSYIQNGKRNLKICMEEKKVFTA